MGRHGLLPQQRRVDSLFGEDTQVFLWFGGDLLCAAGTADVNRLARSVDFVRSTHGVQRFVHHGASLLRRDVGRIRCCGFEDTGSDGLRSGWYGTFCQVRGMRSIAIDHGQILLWFGLNLFDTTFATEKDRLVAHEHLYRLPHAAQGLVHHGALGLTLDQGCVGCGWLGNGDFRTSAKIWALLTRPSHRATCRRFAIKRSRQ